MTRYGMDTHVGHPEFRAYDVLGTERLRGALEITCCTSGLAVTCKSIRAYATLTTSLGIMSVLLRLHDTFCLVTWTFRLGLHWIVLQYCG